MEMFNIAVRPYTLGDAASVSAQLTSTTKRHGPLIKDDTALRGRMSDVNRRRIVALLKNCAASKERQM